MILRKVISYEAITNPPNVILTLECGHKIPIPRGVYDEDTKRMCKECKQKETPST